MHDFVPQEAPAFNSQRFAEFNLFKHCELEGILVICLSCGEGALTRVCFQAPGPEGFSHWTG
jgi:hypothetical protein